MRTEVEVRHPHMRLCGERTESRRCGTTSPKAGNR